MLNFSEFTKVMVLPMLAGLKLDPTEIFPTISLSLIIVKANDYYQTSGSHIQS